MGASALPSVGGLPLGLSAAVQAAAANLSSSPRGAAKRKTSVFNPVLMGGLNAAAAAVALTAANSAGNASRDNTPGGKQNLRGRLWPA